MTLDDLGSALDDLGPSERYLVLTSCGVVYEGTVSLYADSLIEVDPGSDDYNPAMVSLDHIIAIKRSRTSGSV